MFHFHKWSKWKVLHETEIQSYRTGRIKGYAFIQERECTVCGLRKYKEHRITA